jgi:hypothetical protein
MSVKLTISFPVTMEWEHLPSLCLDKTETKYRVR